jgi:hypothetical protein
MSVEGGPDIVTNGLVLYLDAANNRSIVSGSTTWFDLSRNGNTGSLINGPTYSSANGGSILFDGTNDYVGCGDIIRGRTEFSVESWIKTSDTRVGNNGTYQNPSIFGTQHGSGISGDIAVTLKSGNLGFYHELNGGSGYIDTGVFVSNNTWKHIVLTKTTAGVIILYLNGSSIYTGSGFTSAIRTTDLQFFNWEIGRAYWYGEDAQMLRFTGNIATNLLYSRSLAPTEVRQNYHATKGRYGL